MKTSQQQREMAGDSKKTTKHSQSLNKATTTTYTSITSSFMLLCTTFTIHPQDLTPSLLSFKPKIFMFFVCSLVADECVCWRCGGATGGSGVCVCVVGRQPWGEKDGVEFFNFEIEIEMKGTEGWGEFIL